MKACSATARRSILVLSPRMLPPEIELEGQRTDTIVLACTHYPLLSERLERLAPWPVAWIDPAPAIARRVTQLLGPASGGEKHPTERRALDRMVFTSATTPAPDLAAALTRFGLRLIETAPDDAEEASLPVVPIRIVRR